MNKNSIMTALAIMLSFSSFAISPITGSSVVCIGGTSTLTDSTAGGTWSSSNTTVAMISTGGTVTGISAGTANIIYIVGADSVHLPLTINAAPATISGSSTACIGSAITLTDAVAGGSWFSGNTALATVSSAGVVTALATGVLNIYYSMGGTTVSGCTVYHTVTINAAPATISGSSTACIGSAITLTDAVAGGSWISGNTALATVSSAGVVTALAAGVLNIYYAMGSTLSGCTVYHTVTINAAPATISGSSTACIGSAITLTDAVAGGSWFSGNTALATVSSAGVVTALAAGVLNIYYAMGSTLSGCSVYHTVTINAAPATISGSSTACVGSAITLTDAVAGGSWISGNTALATVSSAGVVTALATGVLNIYYAMGSTLSGCSVYHTVTINAAPATISGSSTACIGSAITLTDAVAGGSWFSGNTALATISSAGVVTALATGVLNIYYSMGGTTVSGCTVYHTVTINAAPATISGSSTACIGSAITLTDAVAGGSWFSGNTALATISSAGVVTALATGVLNIYYSMGGTTVSGCTVYHTVTINAAPATISGSSTACIGSAITLTDAVAGGSWFSGNTALATVSSAGVVTALAAGVLNIYYAMGSTLSGCTVYHTVTINAAPATISGSSTACIGSAITLTDAVAGGSWISGNTALATVSSAGVVTALAAGVLNIYYSMGGTTVSGCTVYHTVTINAAPATISGSSTACVGSAITLTDAVAGGSWISGNTALATISSAGVVTALATGVLNIYYSMGGTTVSGCTVYHTVTINAAPATISGSSTACIGSAITLTDAVAGGSWFSGNTALATVSSAGVVTALAAGVLNIYYAMGSTLSGCSVYHTVTINAAPATISGSSTACVGSAITLADAVAGGSWISGNTALATVSSAGVVTALAAGVLNIYYAMGSTLSGCSVYHTVTINAAPATISGSSTACIGSAITLADAVAGGSWISGNTALATVSSAGVVTALAAGVLNIYYAMGSTLSGCSVYHTVTINAAPATISGSSTACIGSAITLADAVAGGSWISGNTALATVSSAGVVTALAAGVLNIYYAMGSTLSGCSVYHTVTINAAPATISGSSTACIGSAITLTDAVAGGSWFSGNTALATVSSAGVVTALATGVLNIYYSMGGTTVSGCTVYHTVTINAAPATISGSSTACIGSAITLTDAVAGGSWISGNTALATVSSAGVVTALAAGVLNIYYAMGSTLSGCTVYHTVTINAAPATISGSSTACIGSAITLTDAVAGGSWFSGNTALATVSSAGVVTALAAGVLNIYYAMGSTLSGCSVYHTVTINAAPATISGSSTACVGSAITLTDAVAGGSWISGNTALATVSSAGVVTALATGVLNIYYAMGSTLSGCSVYHTVTINAAPATISGSSTACIGSAITLTDAVAGGSWFSGNTALATISSAGVVTALATGVLNIYYSMGGTTVSGCTVYHTVTINAAPATISGSSTACIGSAITLTDAVAGGSWISGNTALATVSSAGVVTALAAGVLNIYYAMGSTLSGCSVYHTVTVNAGPGEGSISGYVFSGAGKNTSDGVPVAGMLIHLEDAITNLVLSDTHTDAGGAYSFSSLTDGNYIIYPEFSGYTATPSASIMLNSSSEVATNIDFKQNTLQNTITPFTIVTGIKPAFTADDIRVYPNPANSYLNIVLTKYITGIAAIVITDMTGHEVYKSSMNINNSAQQAQIELAGLDDGVYMISINCGNVVYGNKLIIRR